MADEAQQPDEPPAEPSAPASSEPAPAGLAEVPPSGEHERDVTRAYGKDRSRRKKYTYRVIPPSMQRTQFGKMVASVNKSAPSFGFGTALRFAEGKKSNLPNFISKEHSKQLLPDYTPGPGTYVARSSMGSQAYSEKKSSATPAFIHADRFAMDVRERKMLGSVPSPNAYDPGSSFGAQQNSVKRSESIIGFPGAHRNAQASIGKGYEGALFARDTPGPGNYPVASGYGKQVLAGNVSYPAPPFGREHRAIDPRIPNALERRSAQVPGPGQYSYDPACAPQRNSTKESKGMYSFGKSVDRYRAGFASLDGERANKVYQGLLGPGPASDAAAQVRLLEGANGPQLLSVKASKPEFTFAREMRLRPPRFTNIEAPGPGTYVV